MYYIPDILTARSRGNLSKCWLAATLSSKQFRNMYHPKIINSISVVHACNEIESTICSTSELPKQRYSLYLAAQLTFGAIRIHQEQLQNLDRMLANLEAQLCPPNLKKLNKKQIPPPMEEWDLVHIPSLPSPPDVLFPAELPLDIFQLKEDLPVEFGDLTFGNLDMPIGQPFGSVTDTTSFRPFRDDTVDLSAEHPLENTTNITDYGNLSEAPIRGAVDAPMTPKKRPRSTSTADTPSKRPRRIAPLIDESQPPEPLPAETTMVNLPDLTAEVLVPTEVPEIIQNGQQVPEQPPSEAETLILDSISDLLLDLPARTPRRRPFQDKSTIISTAVMRSRITDTTAATAQWHKTDLAYARHHMLPALTIPSTSWRVRGFHIWAQCLRTTFSMRIQGPFVVEHDADTYPENIRLQNVTTSSGLTLTSDNIIQPQPADHTRKSIVDILPIEHVNEPLGILDAPAVMLELPNMENPPQLPQLDAGEPAVPNTPRRRRSRVSDDTEHRLSSSSSTTVSALIVNDNEIPRFLDDNVELYRLRLDLEKQWQQGKEVLKFDVLVPCATNTVMDASVCLSNLAVLAQNNIIKLLQAEPHDDIWIQKFFSQFDDNSS